MESRPYDVWYDPNEVDVANHAHVLRSWVLPGVEITYGKIILAGDDEVDPVPARIIRFDEATGIIEIELLFNEAHSAVA